MQRKLILENDNNPILQNGLFTCFAANMERRSLTNLKRTCTRAYILVKEFDRMRILNHTYRLIQYLSTLNKKDICLYLRHVLGADSSLSTELSDMNDRYLILIASDEAIRLLPVARLNDIYATIALYTLDRSACVIKEHCRRSISLAHQHLLKQGLDPNCCLMRSIQYFTLSNEVIVGRERLIETFAPTAYLNLQGLDLAHYHLENIDLSWCNLAYVQTYTTTLTGCSLEGADITGAELDGAYMDNVNLSLAYRRVAEVKEPEKPTSYWPCTII